MFRVFSTRTNWNTYRTSQMLTLFIYSFAYLLSSYYVSALGKMHVGG